MEEHGEETNCSLEQLKGDLQLKPMYGMEFDSEEAAYEFYNDYGRRVGFGIRKEVCAKDTNHVPFSHQSQGIGISNNNAGIEFCSQSSLPLSQLSQVPIHSPMMVGHGRYMQMMHNLNMSNEMSWMPSQDSSAPSSQAYVQSNIVGFPFALQDSRTSYYEGL